MIVIQNMAEQITIQDYYALISINIDMSKGKGIFSSHG